MSHTRVTHLTYEFTTQNIYIYKQTHAHKFWNLAKILVAEHEACRDILQIITML